MLLQVEPLERRDLLAVNPLSVTDPRFWGDSGDAPTKLTNMPAEVQSLSADGQLLVYESTASNLVPNDTNYLSDIFLYDRGTGRVKLLSTNASGTVASNGNSSGAVISPDGRYVAYVSNADDILPGVSGLQVYLFDVQTGATTLASGRVSGPAGDASSELPLFSGDGKFLLFVSAANNLDATINGAHPGGETNLFRRELASGSLQMVTVDRSGNQGAGIYPGAGAFNWYNFSISTNGRHVAFVGATDHFSPIDANQIEDVYVRDMQAGVTRLVTIDSTGGFSANQHSYIGPNSVSDNGRLVAFTSFASNLVPDAGGWNAYIRDVTAQQTQRISITTNGDAAGGYNPVLTPDGHYAAFFSDGAGLVVLNGSAVAGPNIYRRDLTTNVTQLVSMNASGTGGGNGPSGTSQYFFDFDRGTPVMTADGRFIAFAGVASDLVTGIIDVNQSQSDEIRRRDVFVRDMTAGTTRLASVGRAGGATGDDGSNSPALSANGLVVAFESNASDLVLATDANERTDVFVRDLTTGITQLASRRSPLLPAELLAGGRLLATSSDGRFVVFTSSDGKRLSPEVRGIGSVQVTYLYWLDRETEEVRLVSVRPDGSATGNFDGGVFDSASISSDGRFVAFGTDANDLDAELVSTVGGIYVRDMHIGETQMVSRNTATGNPRDSASFDTRTTISPNGRFVAFAHDSTNLINGISFDGGYNLFVFDRQTETLRLVSINAARNADGDSFAESDFAPAFSADSTRLAFLSTSSDLVAGVTDTNSSPDVFYIDLVGANAFETRLVSESTTPGVTANNDWGMDGGQGGPMLSANGRFVAFAQRASDLVAGVSADAIQVFVRDLDTGTTELVSATADDLGGNSNSTAPVISSDGKRVLFQSLATDLSDLGTNGTMQLYVRDLASDTTQMVSVNDLGSAGANGFSGEFDVARRARLSADGRYVAFASDAIDLVTGFVNGNGDHPDLFLRDLTEGTTVLTSWNLSGTAASDGPVSAFRLGDNGTVLFSSSASNLVAGDHTGDAVFSGNFEDVFAYVPRAAASIAGVVFNDVNGDGTRSAEAGIPHWSVYIDANNNRRFDFGEETVQTDAAGNYRLNGLAAGSYSIGIVMESGYQQTTPQDPELRTVILTSDTHARTNIDFGARRSAIDLLVEPTFVAATVGPGQRISATWVVRNVGTAAAEGAWQDAVYLSRDSMLDAADVLLGTTSYSSGLAAASAYVGELTVSIPAVAVGEYRLIFETDRRRQIGADNNRANNLQHSSDPIIVSIPILTPGIPAVGSFTPFGNSQYFALTVTPGQPLMVMLDGTSAELYIRRHELPSPSAFDVADLNLSPGESLIVPTTGPGTYYILARYPGDLQVGETESFGITAAIGGFGITELDLKSGGNSGRVTIPVRGTGFTPNTQVELVRGALTLTASAVQFHDAATVYATFDLSGQPIGLYDVVVRDDTNSDTLIGAFTVEAGQSDAVKVTLTTPESLRLGRSGVIVVEYENTGNVDAPAPFLSLIVTEGVLRLEDQEEFIGEQLQILGIAPDGPAGVLRPGQRGQVRVVIQSTGSGDPSQVELGQFDDDAVIDWDALKSELRPDHFAADAWDADFANLRLEIGETVADLRALLGRAATYLGSIGARTADVSTLFQYELDQSNAAFTTGPAFSVADAAFPAPDLALTFVRDRGAEIHRRYMDGPLGRGWNHNWQIHAETLANGDVVIHSGAAFRQFEKQADGSYLSRPGDRGILNRTGDIYTLIEPSNTQTVFLADGRMNFIEGDNGNRITAGYDSSNRLTSLAHTSGESITLRYNGNGRIDLVTDPAGRTVAYEYTSEHLTAYTDQLGRHTYTYDIGANLATRHALTSMNFADDTHTQFLYDTRGRLVRQDRDNGAVPTTYEYLADGGFIVRDALNNATTVLTDHRGQVRRVIAPLGNTAEFSYDAHGNRTAAHLPGGISYAFEFDINDQLTRAIDPLGHVTNFSFCGCGSLTSFTDALGRTTTYEYDEQDNLTSITRADGSAEHFTYDARGNVDMKTNRRGRVIDFDTNADGQVTRKRFADGGEVNYSYDVRGRMTDVSEGPAHTTLEYWPTDVLRNITYPDGKSLEFEYDAGGRRTRSVDHEGFETNYAYDTLGRLEELTNKNGARVVRYSYDAAGRLAREDRGNLTATTYAYDELGRVTQITHLKSDGLIVDSSFAYQYDAIGRRTKMTTEDGGVTAYRYDALGQLTDVALPDGRTIHYDYDAVGNRTRVVDSLLGITDYTVNELNQYLSVGEVTFTYDADGNIASRTDPTGTTTYSFDDENRLISLSGPGISASYSYSGLGHRNGEVVNGTATAFLIDPSGLWSSVADYRAGGSVARYIYGLGLVSRVDADGAVYFDFDAIGNTAGISDASGAYVNRYRYLPFGETTVVSTSVVNRFTFGGRFGVRADVSGTFDMRFREYDAISGRFLSDDPIGLSGGDENLRRFVSNDPVSHVDPLGLVKSEDCYIYVNAEDYLARESQKVLIAIRESEQQLINLLASYRGFGLAPDSGIGSQIRRLNDRIANLREQLRQLEDMRQEYSLIRIPCPGDYIAPKPKPPTWGPTFGPVLDGIIEWLSAFDPNDITGPSGNGPQRFVPFDGPMPYTIRFENQPSATAAAQEVFVTQTLDADLDPATFELGDFGFGSLLIDVPAGRQNFQTRVNYTNVAAGNTPLFIDIIAAFNPVLGQVVWTFRSIDPSTGLLPDGILEGMLPPNDDTHRGEGFVQFIVRPREDRVFGTTTDQQASIVFDTNDPILTNVFTNTLGEFESPGSGTVELLAELDVSHVGSPDITGSADIFASLTLLDSGDPTQQSIVDQFAIGSGTISGSIDAATTIEGTFETDNSAPQITFTFLAAPLLDMDVTQTGTFEALVNGSQVNGTFVAIVNATMDFSNQTASGTIEIEFSGSGGFEHIETISFSNQPLTKTPSDFELPASDLGSVGDRVWFDDNQNGVFDATETAATGIQVSLMDTVNGVIGDGDDDLAVTTRTNAAGFFSFINIPAGDYYLEFAPLLTGQNFTDPNMGTDDSRDSDIDPQTRRSGIVTIASATHTRNLDAGIRDSLARWQNPADRFNVSATAGVDPFDVVLILRELKIRGNRRLDPNRDPPPAPYFDVSGDNRVTPQDVLQVLTKIKQGSAEGESRAKAAHDEVFAGLSWCPLPCEGWYSELRSRNTKRKRT